MMPFQLNGLRVPVAVAALVGAGVLGAAEVAVDDVAGAAGADCITAGAETVGAGCTAFGTVVVDKDSVGV